MSSITDLFRRAFGVPPTPGEAAILDQFFPDPEPELPSHRGPNGPFDRIDHAAIVLVVQSSTVDGTDTFVTVTNENGETVGVGTSRRRKGDVRDNGIGIRLATARALRDAADTYAVDLPEGYDDE